MPTLDELGVKGYEAQHLHRDLRSRRHAVAGSGEAARRCRKALANATVRERFRGMGVEIMDMGQAEFAAYVRADFDKWRQVAREGNIVVE